MQDFLTALIAIILLFSVIYFSSLFVSSVPEYERQIRNRNTRDLIVSVPTPVISEEQANQNLDEQIDASILTQQVPLLAQSILTASRRTTPIALPTVSIEQADQNLDKQITALLIADKFPMECRTLLTPTTKTPKNNSHRKAKAKNMGKPATTTIAPKVRQQSPKKPSVLNLRKLCTTNSIKWQNAHGKNRHLTQNQMVEALKNKGVTL